MLAVHRDIVNLEDIIDDISKMIIYYDTIYVIYKHNCMYYSVLSN